jgi:hypothetical protein
MKLLSKRFGRIEAPGYLAAGAFALIIFLFLLRLSSLTISKAANLEIDNVQRSLSANYVLHNPLNGPFYAALHLMRYVSHSLYFSRFIAVIFAFLAVILMYYIANKWIGWKLAAIATLLFGTNSIMLHSARLVDPSILQVVVSLGLLALFSATYKHYGPRRIVLWAVGIPIMLYVPGALWLVGITLILARGRVLSAWGMATKLTRTISTLISMLIISPLIYFLATTGTEQNLSGIKTWLGVRLLHGNDFIGLTWLKNFLKVPVQLFWHGDGDIQPAFGLANTPTLDAAMGLLALLGLYIVVTRHQDQRWRYTLILLLTSWLAIALGVLTTLVLLPVCYLLAVIGLAYLLSEWYKIFPRNPIARSFGFVLILAVVSLSVTYNLRAYFVAWPHSVRTMETFSCNVESSQLTNCIEPEF